MIKNLFFKNIRLLLSISLNMLLKRILIISREPYILLDINKWDKAWPNGWRSLSHIKLGTLLHTAP